MADKREITEKSMDEQTRNILKNSDRYKGFALFGAPRRFSGWMAGKAVPLVQVHSTEPAGKDGIVGFCGAFTWDGSEISSLDGDVYNKDMSVYGYKWFKNDSGNCLDVLAGNDW